MLRNGWINCIDIPTEKLVIKQSHYTIGMTKIPESSFQTQPISLRYNWSESLPQDVVCFMCQYCPDEGHNLYKMSSWAVNLMILVGVYNLGGQFLDLNFWLGRSVGSTNVKNVTTLGVIIFPRQMSQHRSQHQQQTSNNDKRHRGFWSQNNKRQNVTKWTYQVNIMLFE